LGDVQQRQQVIEALEVVPVIKGLDVPQHDHRQVNDWDMLKSGTNHVKKREEIAPMLNPSMTTGIIKISLRWSEHRTQARQTMTQSAIMY
jgi:hypothetical protein